MSACTNLPDPKPAMTDVSERGRSGRIEAYLHSDSITPNKGGAMVKVTCDTDFAARTFEFQAFAQRVAKYAYASAAGTWLAIVAAYPEMADELESLRKTLGERVEVHTVVVMKI